MRKGKNKSSIIFDISQIHISGYDIDNTYGNYLYKYKETYNRVNLIKVIGT